MGCRQGTSGDTTHQPTPCNHLILLAPSSLFNSFPSCKSRVRVPFPAPRKPPTCRGLLAFLGWGAASRRSLVPADPAAARLALSAVARSVAGRARPPPASQRRGAVRRTSALHAASAGAEQSGAAVGCLAAGATAPVDAALSGGAVVGGATEHTGALDTPALGEAVSLVPAGRAAPVDAALLRWAVRWAGAVHTAALVAGPPVAVLRAAARRAGAVDAA